jgi:hypothetical protein
LNGECFIYMQMSLLLQYLATSNFCANGAPAPAVVCLPSGEMKNAFATL